MELAGTTDRSPSKRVSWLKRIAPAITLIVLAPIVAEVLSGATRISYLIVLIPEVMVWGCGALLIHEIVLRWHAGWTSMLLLGLALSVAEEFIIQQTSIAPLPWLGSGLIYGRAWGVNWIYFLYMLGYESVWVVLVPVQLTRLIFPARRNDNWLRTGGLIVAGLAFLVGSFIAWFAWTQRARTVVFHAPKYQPPSTLIVAGLLAIALLTIASWALRDFSGTKMNPPCKTPKPWQIGIGSFLLGLPWWLLLALVFIPSVSIAFLIPLVAGVLWALSALFLIPRWASGSNWSDMHRWALISSAILVCMLGGFAGSSAWPRIDLIGKVVLNLIAIVCLLALRRNLYKSPRSQRLVGL